MGENWNSGSLAMAGVFSSPTGSGKSVNQTSHLLFASCAPGLEPLLQAELVELGLGGELREGGVEVRTTTDGLYRIVRGSALAEGVRVRLKAFVARDFETLKVGAAKLPWRAYLRAGQRASVRAVCHRSRLWHSGAVEQRVAEVLRERAGVEVVDARGEPEPGAESETVDEEALLVHVRISGDAVQISVDAAGRLHRRGYRSHVERASLRETLAAALVRVAVETATAPPRAIWDPFCGAGTVAFEAARYFAGVAPGVERAAPLERWPTHDAVAWERAAEQLGVQLGARRPAIPPLVIGSDHAGRAIDAATHNAQAAGAAVELRLGDFAAEAARVPEGAWIVSNPPYGERLDNEWLPGFLRLLDSRRDLRPVVLLLGGEAKRQLPGRFRSALVTKNGGLDVGVRVLR
ncbi:MAG TPA: hypothetical protein VLC09_14205 [Polyangiaceae bacterium]|nr:hypothetical protein [Polyangiaceae bacterium]